MIKIVLIAFIVLAWFSLPYVPALHEWRKKRDAKPLNVVREYDVDVHRFANVFQSYINSQLGEAMRVCEESGVVQSGVLEDGTAWQVLPRGTDPVLDAGAREQQLTQVLLVARGDLDLPGGMSYLAEILAYGNIRGGEGDIYRAIRAHGDIDIATESMLLRWLHADGDIRIAGGSVMHGRVSADGTIHISRSAHFQRLFAPRIIFGAAPDPQPLPTGQKPIAARDLDRRVEVAGRRWLFKHDLEIPGYVNIDADLVVTGKLNIGPGVCITGSVKSYEPLVVNDLVHIKGSLVSNTSLILKQGVRVRGPLVAEDSVILGTACIIAEQQRPATITAETIRISESVLAHGTVWARRDGEVVTAVQAAELTT